MRTLMTTIVIVMTLIGGVCHLKAGVAPAALDLASLQASSEEYGKALTPDRIVPEKAKSGRVLVQAAEVMLAERQCSESMALTKMAIRYLGADKAPLWQLLAEAAACQGTWNEVGFAAYLAFTGTNDQALQNSALALLGESLVRQANWGDDWESLALAIFSQLRSQVGGPELEKKINYLKHLVDEKKKLVVKKAYATTSGEQPSLCIEFSRALLTDDSIRYGDYIRFSPALDGGFTVEDQTVCVDGAAYGSSYEVVVRKGMPATDGSLEATFSQTLATGHRESALWFNKNAYVLPKADQAGIALYSVNIKEVNLAVYRIHERNILSRFVSQQFRANLSEYELDNLSESMGEKVWTGSTTIDGPADRNQASSLVLPDRVINAPGLYVISAKNAGKTEESWKDLATQWLVVTDIGLTAYAGDEGLAVVARSLATAKPLPGVKLTLLARNNSPLAEAVSDDEGVATFAGGLLKGQGGMEPVQVTVAGTGHGFAFLQLDQPAFDLSDRGVGGRATSGPLDAYVYTERGIYRPGESLTAVAILRDSQGRGVADLPLTARLLGPDGSPVQERVVKADPSGAYVNSFALARNAAMGSWRIALYVDVTEKPVGEVAFEVHAFVPPRLEVSLSGTDVLSETAASVLAVQADYLYGAAGSDLTANASMVLSYDSHPFADYGEYFFGRMGEEVNIPEIYLEEVRTNQTGKATFTLNLAEQSDTLQPLKAEVGITVMDIDGRKINKSIDVPVRHLPWYVGLKANFADLHAQADGDAGFALISLDPAGKPLIPESLSYLLVEEEIDYQWFRRDSEWGYERAVKDREIARQDLQVDATGQVQFTVPVKQGEYRLEILGPDRNVVTSVRFTAGDQVAGMGDTPDMVKVELDRASYKVGDKAKLKIVAPFAGEASLVLAGRNVHSIRHFPLAATGEEVEIAVDEAWGSGAYALVTVFRPGGEKDKANRAIGVIWLGIDPDAQRLDVALEVPEQVTPRQTISIPVQIKGAASAEQVYLTLAAVDEGVLGLTEFASPDPLAYFFARQKLGTEIRDIYGRLIDDGEGKPLVLREGAGDDDLRGAPDGNIQVVSLFSGVVKVDGGGRAVVELALPDYNGRLRLMAVAWSSGKLGAANGAMQVSDPVVVSPSLPRFLTEGDQAEMTLLLQNLRGAAGDYQIKITGSGAVGSDQPTATARLAVGDRRVVKLPIQAKSIGKGAFHVEVLGPESMQYQGDYPLNVRGRQLPLLTRNFMTIEPGKEFRLDTSLIAGLREEDAEVRLTISNGPNLDVGGLLDQLDRYPYGCLEQLVSRAMPLLFANELAARWDRAEDPALAAKLVDAIEAIVQKQLYDGSFAVWSPDGEGDDWLSVYAMEFLVRARIAGFTVADFFFDRGLAWLEDQAGNVVDPPKEKVDMRAYAHYVLSLAGKGKAEDARYLFDTSLAEMSSSLSVAQLAVAMANMGDLDRAQKGFTAALTGQKSGRQDDWLTYASPLRDTAGMISLISSADPAFGRLAELWERLTRQMASQTYLSTQEQAWLIMAALRLNKQTDLQLTVDGKEEAVGDIFSLRKTGGELKTASTIVNKGTSPAWAVLTVVGSPQAALPPLENNFRLQRSLLTTAGKPLAGPIHQGDLVVVLLKGEMLAKDRQEALMVDLLPSGFEIENTHPELIENTTYAWLPELAVTRSADGFDDRYVAAIHPDQFNDEKKKKIFNLAYLVRAVTPGSYIYPAAEVEDMYQPAYRARTAASRVEIVNPSGGGK